MNKLICLFLVLFASCQSKQESPEAVLEKYVEGRFSESGSKDDLLKLTSGALYAQINEMSPDEFAKFVGLNGIKRGKFKVLNKKCKEDKCFITYFLSYRDSSDKPAEFAEVEVKKIAEIELEDKRWKISDISNLKTFINSQGPLEL